MLKNLFTNLFKSKKRIYFSHWDVHFNGDQACEDFVVTQITSKKLATHENFAGLELIFVDQKLAKAYSHEFGAKNVRVLEADEIGYPLPNYAPNPYFQIIEEVNGPHQMGGEIPAGFKIPEHNCVVPFQYFGFINNEDPKFNWLPFPVHLICPIYLNFRQLFLDYSNPNAPIILNTAEMEAADTSFKEDLNRQSEIVFEAMRFGFTEGFKNEPKASAGVPQWIQYPDIPHCPKTGKRMRFLCQMLGGVKTKRTNVTPKNEYRKRNFEKLNFWGSGDIFIFFEPESKTACYMIQNT
ncbi:MAG: hypothetical protein WCR52_04580 [Bacteroidota bacterium]